jgi:hypothetical protein
MGNGCDACSLLAVRSGFFTPTGSDKVLTMARSIITDDRPTWTRQIPTLLRYIGLRNALNRMSEHILRKHDFVATVESFLTDIPINNFYAVHSLAVQATRGWSTGRTTHLLKPHFQPAHIIYKDKNIVAISTDTVNIMRVYFTPVTEPELIMDSMVEIISQLKHEKPTVIKRKIQLSHW